MIRLFLQKEELQVQLQALHIEEYVKFSTYSPTSPDVQEPFRLPVETEEQESFVGVTELIPLDQVNNPYWISRKNCLELIKLSRINKVSLA